MSLSLILVEGGNRRFDEGKFRKYTVVVDNEEGAVLYQFNIWYNSKGFFADDVIVKYRDVNGVVHYDLRGIVSDEHKDVFGKHVDEHHVKLVCKEFAKVWENIHN